MKKSIGLLMFVGLLFSAVSAQAITVIQAKSFAASASVGAVNSFTAIAKLVTNNSTTTDTLTFGAQSNASGTYAGVPLEYLAINVSDNAPLWKMHIYSNNYTTVPATATWGLQYGGLKGATAGDKVSMAWQASTSTIAGAPALGILPGQPNSAWTYLKDLKDVNDLGKTGASWAEADAAGYANIAFGGGSIGTSVVTSAGMISLATPTGQFNLYSRGDFSVAPADTYTGTITVELYHP
jgi:hypothetical protein